MRPSFQKQAKPRARDTVLGPLERRLLELLWARPQAARVRDMQRELPELAYTTVMTTLDRLYRKGLLVRQKSARAFEYAPRYARGELLSNLISEQLADLLGAGRQHTALLSTLVRTVSQKDAALLDELEILVRAERQRLKTRPDE